MPATTAEPEPSAPALSWPVLIAVPPAGLGPQLALMRAWLDHSCGPSGWTVQSVDRGEGVVAFRFADPAAARAFVARFGCGYRAAAELRV